MVDRQIFGMILLSGFSTAKQVTDLSGRGVSLEGLTSLSEKILSGPPGYPAVRRYRRQGSESEIKTGSLKLST